MPICVLELVATSQISDTVLSLQLHVLVAEFLHLVISIVCTGIARIFAVGVALIAVVSY